VQEQVPQRPFDRHVEPLYAGLGLADPAPRSTSGRKRRPGLALLLALAAAALAWWLA